MLGLSLAAVDEWYDRWFGGLLAAGTVAQLAYARRLMQLPVAVVGQAIATAALPTLSRLSSRANAKRSTKSCRRRCKWGSASPCSRPQPLRLRGADRRSRLPPRRLQRRRRLRGHVLAARLLDRRPRLGAPADRGEGLLCPGRHLAPDAARHRIEPRRNPALPRVRPALGRRTRPRVGRVIAMLANTLVTLLLARRLHGAPAFVDLRCQRRPRQRDRSARSRRWRRDPTRRPGHHRRLARSRLWLRGLWRGSARARLFDRRCAAARRHATPGAPLRAKEGRAGRLIPVPPARRNPASAELPLPPSAQLRNFRLLVGARSSIGRARDS